MENPTPYGPPILPDLKPGQIAAGACIQGHYYFVIFTRETTNQALVAVERWMVNPDLDFDYQDLTCVRRSIVEQST